MIVIAGFGAIGAFLYFLLTQNNYKPLVISRREIKSYTISFFEKNRLIHSFEVQNINRLVDQGEIEYLFLCTKAQYAKGYLQSLLKDFVIKNLVLTQNGIGLEDEIKEIFCNNLYYLTFTSALEFEENKLIVYNTRKMEIVLSYPQKNLQDFKINLKYRDVFFRKGQHLSVRFSKLILNLILNVVPVAFGGLPWEVFPTNKEAIKIEKNLISEIVSLMQNLRIPFFNFKGYNTSLISCAYKYLPYEVFEKFYSKPELLKGLRNNRIPSFYRDLFIKKQPTEVDYYLGWYKKFADFKLSTVKQVYELIKQREYKEIYNQEVQN